MHFKFNEATDYPDKDIRREAPNQRQILRSKKKINS